MPRVAEHVRLAVDGIAQKPEFWRLGLMLTLEDQPVELLARRRFVEIRRDVLDHLSALLNSEAARRTCPARPSHAPTTSPV